MKKGFLVLLTITSIFIITNSFARGGHGGGFHGGGFHGGGFHGGRFHGGEWHGNYGHVNNWGNAYYYGAGTAAYVGVAPSIYYNQCDWVPGQYNNAGYWIPGHCI